MKKILLFLSLLAAGCGCKDISCPSDQLRLFSGYVPDKGLQFTNGTATLEFSVNVLRQVTPASVPAEKANESFVRVCKPTQNCYEKAQWEARNGNGTDTILIRLDMQLVTPAHTQAAVIFPQGQLTVNGDSYAFVFSPDLESPQAARSIADTTIASRRFEKVLEFQPGITNRISRLYLAQGAGVIGLSLRNTAETFWRTDL